ncbi:MAG: helix-turn-helix domain-containing protein [Acidobacteria bacterium]|nr:helix-turn-helix domain-containing protein [Acidobacteriota bacterium]
MNRTPGFLGERLVQAREARLLTATSLAEMIGVRSANISHYEHGKQSPSPEVMEKIAQILNQPVAFFMRPMPKHDQELWWRSMTSATKGARARAKARHSWLREVVSYLSDYVDFPNVSIPDFHLTGDVQAITDDMIEDIAMQCS